jgi:hypothetical protein
VQGRVGVFGALEWYFRRLPIGARQWLPLSDSSLGPTPLKAANHRATLSLPPQFSVAPICGQSADPIWPKHVASSRFSPGTRYVLEDIELRQHAIRGGGT